MSLILDSIFRIIIGLLLLLLFGFVTRRAPEPIRGRFVFNGRLVSETQATLVENPSDDCPQTCRIDDPTSCHMCGGSDGTDDSYQCVAVAANDGSGLCVRQQVTDDETSRIQCTAKYGGRLIVAKEVVDDVDGSERLVFRCLCTEPETFNRMSLHGDCDVFVGCVGGTVSVDDGAPFWPGTDDDNLHIWSDMRQLQCNCPHGTIMARRPTSGEAYCKPVNIFRDPKEWNSYQSALADEFIDPAYKSKLNDDDALMLPNPCQYDAITGKFIGDIGSVVLSPLKSVAYCTSNDPRYVTVVFSSDYLRNNDGRFANGIVKVFSRVAPRYAKERLLETHTQMRRNGINARGPIKYYPIIRGIRSPYKYSLIKLPHMRLDIDQVAFKYAQKYTSENEMNESFVYAFSAYEPETERQGFGTFINMGHTFSIPSQFFTCELIPRFCSIKPIGSQLLPSRVATSHGNDILVHGFPVTRPFSAPYKYDLPLDLFEKNGNLLDDIKDKNIFLPATLNWNTINVNTHRFTGLYLNYTIDGRLYCKSIYPSDTITLKKYRDQAVTPMHGKTVRWSAVRENRTYNLNYLTNRNDLNFYNQQTDWPTENEIQGIPEDIFGFVNKPHTLPSNLKYITITRDTVSIKYTD